jgi:hypothetical protein
MNWDAVVERMGEYHKPLQAVLRSFHIVRVENGRVEIGAEHDFHVGQARKKVDLIRTVVSEIAGRDVAVAVVKDSGGDEWLTEMTQYAVEELGAVARRL